MNGVQVLSSRQKGHYGNVMAFFIFGLWLEKKLKNLSRKCLKDFIDKYAGQDENGF